jgi:hypothetical protein
LKLSVSVSNETDPLKVAAEVFGSEVTAHEVNWIKNFNSLLEFHEKYGHINISISMDQKLHCWLKRQKTLKKAKSLDAGREGLLQLLIDEAILVM